MKSPYQEIREALRKGERDRADYLIQELEPQLGHKITEGWKTLGAYPFGKYSARAIEASEKIYNEKLINSLYSQAIAEGDADGIRSISRIHEISRARPSNFKNSIEFSKMIYNAYERSKFMPLKNAINSDLLYRLTANKNAAASQQAAFADPDEGLNAILGVGKAFGKGVIGSPLELANEVKNVAAMSGYNIGKYTGFKGLKDISEKASRKNINIFADDPDSDSWSYLAGGLSSMVGSIAYGSAYRAGKITASGYAIGKQKISQLIMKDIAKNTAAGAGVMAVAEIAGVATEKVAESLGLDETNIRGMKSLAKLITFGAAHRELTKPAISELESLRQESAKDAIDLSIKKMRKSSEKSAKLYEEFRQNMREGFGIGDIAEETTEATKTASNIAEMNEVESKLIKIENKFEDLDNSKLPKDQIAPLPSADKDSIGEIFARDEKGNSKFINKYGDISTIDDFYKASPDIQENGVIKVIDNSPKEGLVSAARASLSNDISEQVEESKFIKSQERHPEISAADKEVILQGFNPDNFNDLELMAIAIDPRNVKLEALTDPETAAFISYLKGVVSQYKDLSKEARMQRIASIKAFGKLAAFDETVLDRFLGTQETGSYQNKMSLEEMGEISDAFLDISNAMIKDVGAAGYQKYHPKIDKFDTKSIANENYISTERSKFTNEFNKLITDQNNRYAFENISSAGGKHQTLYFENKEGELVPTGAFLSTINELLSGDSKDPKFYSDLKTARTLLSKNNPYGYQTPIPDSARKNPKSKGFITIRETLIDPIYEAMQKVRESSLTKEELSEYLMGEKRWKDIDSIKTSKLSRLLSMNIQKNDSRTQSSIYKNLYTDPSTIATIQKVVGGMNVEDYMIENALRFPKWQLLIDNGSVSRNSNPFNVIRTLISADTLKGYLFAEGRNANESLAAFADNIGAPKANTLRKFHELWDKPTFKAFDMLIDSDRKAKSARITSGKYMYNSGSVLDDIIKYKKSKVETAALKTLIKAAPVKQLKLILKGIVGDIEKATLAQNKEAIIKQLSEFFSGSLLIQDAILSVIDKLGKFPKLEDVLNIKGK